MPALYKLGGMYVKQADELKLTAVATWCCLDSLFFTSLEALTLGGFPIQDSRPGFVPSSCQVPWFLMFSIRWLCEYAKSLSKLVAAFVCPGAFSRIHSLL